MEHDSDYYKDLRTRLTFLIKRLRASGADNKTVEIARQYSDRVCDALRSYYKGEIVSCYQKIENLVKGCGTHQLAVSKLENNKIFPGFGSEETQFFRARTSKEFVTYELKDMLHLPLSSRAKGGYYRFSIPGVTSMYLANSSYGCWIEMDKPAEHDFYVAPIILDGQLRIFNLAVMTRDLSCLNDCKEDYVHCWIKLVVLMIATSYVVKESNRQFKSEYIVSQSIMLACKKQKYDGVAYYSKRVKEEMAAIAATNCVLFCNIADFRKKEEYSEVCNHIKIDAPMNYQLFKQLNQSAIESEYSMRLKQAYIEPVISDSKRHYDYRNTEFFRFDEFLFSSWKDKDVIEWGNAINTK